VQSAFRVLRGILAGKAFLSFRGSAFRSLPVLSDETGVVIAMYG